MKFWHGKTVRETFDSHWRLNETSGCHEWQRSMSSGYGQLNVGGKPMVAHRYQWIRTRGAIPDGLHVLHRCDNRKCVNVDHLFLGTNLDNIRDMRAKGRGKNGGVYGESHHWAKLTLAVVDSIRRDYDTGLFSQRDLARKYGVSQTHVGSIARGESWGAKSRTSPVKSERVRRQTVAESFYRHFHKDEATGCWLWKLALNEDGYGHVKVKSKRIGAHRFSYEMAYGPVATGLVVRHTCDRRDCVNPQHLRLGTQAENIRDMVARGRQSTGRGENSGKAKLTAMQARDIWRRATAGEKRVDLGKEFGVTASLVSAIVFGRVWRHEVMKEVTA